MDAILFIHHMPLREPTVTKHLALARAWNKDCEVIALEADSFKDSDIAVFKWFEANRPKHERFILLDQYTFCTQSCREFYGSAVDYTAAAYVVVQPWSNDVLPLYWGGPVRQRDWQPFAENTSPELYPFLRGMMPVSGCLFRHDALFNMVQIWKTNRLLDNMWPECRLGTLAAMAGYEPKKIKPDAQRYLASAFAFTVDIGQGPGIYHPCRT